jgi:hypothetical protein
MTATRYSARHNVRTDLWDSITPNNVVQRDVSAPHGEWKPAPWLPTVFTKSNVGAGTDAFVISSGKVIAMDRQGYIVPAGLRAAFAKTAATTVLTYTSTDYDWGVVDLTTGARYGTNGTTTYNAGQVALALLERGLVPYDSFTGHAAFDFALGTLSDAQIIEIIQAFVKPAIGVAAYDVLVWAGLPEDGDQWYHNYTKQHQIQFLTELQMKVPHRVANSTSADSFDVSDIDAGVLKVAAVIGDGDFPIAGEVWTAAALTSLSRYSIAATDTVVAWGLANRPVATNVTGRTAISCDVTGVLTNEKTSIAGISSEGDWYLDAEVGLIFTHSSTYATLVAANSDPTFSYYYYDDANTGTTTERYIFFDGEGTPGDDISYDEKSNFVVMASTGDALGGSNTRSLGRIHRIQVEPRGYLDKVKTAFNLSNMDAKGKTAGSATSGYSSLIHLAADIEDVADRVVVVTIRV